MLTETDEMLAAELALPAEEQLILRERRRAIDDFKRDPALLRRRTEWVGRQEWIQDVLDKLGPGRANLLQLLSLADKMWDKMLPSSTDKKKQGVAFRHRSEAAFPGYNPARSTELVRTPPEGTRAADRASLILKLIAAGYTDTMDWEGTKKKELLNPYGKHRQAA